VSRADQLTVERAGVDASPALSLQCVLHFVQVWVCGSDVVEGYLLLCGHRLNATMDLYLKRQAVVMGVSPHHSKMFPPAVQRRLGNDHRGPVLHVARGVRGQVVLQHVGEHHDPGPFSPPQRQATGEVLVVVVAVERALGAVNTREESEQEVEGTAEPG